MSHRRPRQNGLLAIRGSWIRVAVRIRADPGSSFRWSTFAGLACCRPGSPRVALPANRDTSAPAGGRVVDEDQRQSPNAARRKAPPVYPTVTAGSTVAEQRRIGRFLGGARDGESGPKGWCGRSTGCGPAKSRARRKATSSMRCSDRSGGSGSLDLSALADTERQARGTFLKPCPGDSADAPAPGCCESGRSTRESPGWKRRSATRGAVTSTLPIR
jgi:hypothetical protein